MQTDQGGDKTEESSADQESGASPSAAENPQNGDQEKQVRVPIILVR